MENPKKRKLKIIMIICIVLAAVIGTTAYLVFSNKTPDIAESESFDLSKRITDVKDNGGTLELSEGEVNTTIKTLIDKPIEKNGMIIKGAYVNIEDGEITLYAPINYKGMNILPNVTGNISFENDKLIYKIDSIKVGKLSMPKDVLINDLKNFSNEDVVIEGDRIEISRSLIPFNAENIYLSGDKVIADLNK